MTRKKILIVDDEKGVSELLEAYLENDGYEVIVAFDGKNALAEVQQKKPDIILLDLNLPGNQWFRGLQIDPRAIKSADYHADSKG